MLFPETTERSNRETLHLMTGKIGMLFTAAVLLAGGCATNSLERSLPGEEGVDPAAVQVIDGRYTIITGKLMA